MILPTPARRALRRRAKAGRYRLTATPVDATGNAGQPTRVRFTVAAAAARR